MLRFWPVICCKIHTYLLISSGFNGGCTFSPECRPEYMRTLTGFHSSNMRLSFCVLLFVQIYPRRWLQAAQLLADLLQNHKQHSPPAAHLAHTTEVAPESGPPQTGMNFTPATTESCVSQNQNGISDLCASSLLTQNNTAKLVKQLSKSADTEGLFGFASVLSMFWRGSFIRHISDFSFFFLSSFQIWGNWRLCSWTVGWPRSAPRVSRAAATLLLVLGILCIVIQRMCCAVLSPRLTHKNNDFFR